MRCATKICEKGACHIAQPIIGEHLMLVMISAMVENSTVWMFAGEEFGDGNVVGEVYFR